MKIAFDAKRITHNATGLGNYSRYIVNILSSVYPKNKYLLFTPSTGNKSLMGRISNSKSIIFHYPLGVIQRCFKSLWRSYFVTSDLLKNKVDLYHGLSNEIPMNLKENGIKSIVTIHDLIFLRFPTYYNYIDRLIYTYKFKKACENADHIIAISEMTKRDIVSYFNIDPSKITVIYQNCDNSFSIKATDDKKTVVRNKYNLPERYILSVGSIEDRKNVLLIIKALEHTKEDVKFISIGKRTDYTIIVENYIKTHGLEDRVTLLHDVTFDELPTFYQLATLFIYPSFFEGFGIPVLEALHSGVPVIAAKGSCLEEAGGENSLYINPNDELELADKINMLLSDEKKRRFMQEKGKEYTNQFSDEIIARKITELYLKIKDQSN